MACHTNIIDNDLMMIRTKFTSVYRSSFKYHLKLRGPTFDPWTNTTTRSLNLRFPFSDRTYNIHITTPN